MRIRTAIRAAGAGAALAGGVYATYVASTWLRYGHPAPRRPESDTLLDRFMPVYEVGDWHEIAVAAPADVTLTAASEVELTEAPLARAMFKGREWIMRSRRDEQPRPRGLVADMQALGWGVLAHVPGHELVVGSITRPWEADVVFRALPPDDFLSFAEPGYTKIAWTLRADAAGPSRSIFSTETRAVTTDAHARAKFRLYWSCLSPGIRLIRVAMLRAVKREAEARAGRTLADETVVA